MRRILGVLAVLTLLGTASGCGDEAPPDATDPAPSSAPAPTDQTTDPAPGGDDSDDAEDGYDVVLLHQTATGGTVSDSLVPITTAPQLEAFVADLTSEDLAADVRAEAEAARTQGSEALAAVVALGCDVPEEATVTPGSTLEDWTVSAPTSKQTQECFAAVTTVAVVTVRS